MSDRRAVRPSERPGPAVERDGRLWRVRSLDAGRAVLRARHATTQAGFTAEHIPQGRLEHRPILISDGPVHDEQRSKVARFFAPAVVEGYREAITASARRRLDEAAGRGPVALDDLALYFSVEVTADIVGLTHERRRDTPHRRERRIRGMAHRLVSVFNQPPFDLTRDDLGRTPREWALAARRGLGPVASFYLADVRPALAQRRRRPADDVISHLVREGYSTTNVLIEALTYGTAGMVTTREFISMAAWHLLTTPDLATRFREADPRGRQAILHEIIRLEPVVGHLYRRVTQAITVPDGDATIEFQPGDLVDVVVRDTNVDPTVMDDAEQLCPGRALPSGVRPTVLTFGDGAHRCPGEPLALLEAEILLGELLIRHPRLVSEPQLGWDDLVSGYELRGLRVAWGR